MKIIIDIWGGKNSLDFVARFIRSFDDAIEIAREELHNGFLVNLRADAAWGKFEEFDNRKTKRSN